MMMICAWRLCVAAYRHQVGSTITWWSVSSTTSDQQVTHANTNVSPNT